MHVLVVQVGDGSHVPFTLLLAANDENTGVGDFHRLAIVQLPPRVTDLNCRTPAQSAGGGGG